MCGAGRCGYTASSVGTLSGSGSRCGRCCGGESASIAITRIVGEHQPERGAASGRHRCPGGLGRRLLRGLLAGVTPPATEAGQAIPAVGALASIAVSGVGALACFAPTTRSHLPDSAVDARGRPMAAGVGSLLVWRPVWVPCATPSRLGRSVVHRSHLRCLLHLRFVCGRVGAGRRPARLWLRAEEQASTRAVLRGGRSA